MSLLGKITNSLLSGTNENNLALASVNFDFTLIKLEPPAEFNALGTALSTKRRNEAEEGIPHKTARRLGALFEEKIPSTPKLIAAYGSRISEIIQVPGVNPRGSTSHGPFESFVGADGTSIWAAATSGISALGVHLLSCLLARAWDAKQSTSLWVELVDARRKEIEGAYRDNHVVSPSSLLSARQDISRQDLAMWDSSARSWLRSADQAKNWEQHQLALILKNIQASFSGGPSTYAKVIDVWRKAMVGMEEFLCGRPQSISDGSIFLAFSAWHFFPDLIVLGNETVNVKFNDKLIPKSAIGTVGLESSTSNPKGGIRWSLALSHLRYYGGPVIVESNQDSTRIMFSQLRLVCLGSILGAWRISPRDFLAVARWFNDLWAGLPRGDSKRSHGKRSRQFGWLHNLVKAARDLVSSKGSDHQRDLQLLKYGVRRAKTFLSEDPYTMSPFFGLCNSHVIAGLSESFDTECGIRYLRAVAHTLKLGYGDAVICIALDAHLQMDPGEIRSWEYATAVPHARASKTSDSKDSSREEVHGRWYHTIDDNPLSPRGSEEPIFRLLSGQEIYGKLRGDTTNAAARINRLVQHGEICYRVTNGPRWRRTVVQQFAWPNPPGVYSQNFSTQNRQCPSVAQGNTACVCFSADISCKSNGTTLQFDRVAGDWRLGLYVLETEWRDEFHLSTLRRKATNTEQEAPLPSVGVQSFSATPLHKYRLSDYLCSMICANLPAVDYDARAKSLETNRKKSTTPGISLISKVHKLSESYCLSLHALDLASNIYRNLSASTVSLKVVSKCLHHSLWLPRPLFEPDAQPPIQQYDQLTFNPFIDETARSLLHYPVARFPNRAESFACIAMFESGTLDLEPSELDMTLAVCSENSIFVAGVALSDPFDHVAGHDIRHLVGNIGRPGLCMLVAPQNPRVREPTDQFNVVTHAPYNSKRENNFRGTSLHLSFTDWTFPLETGETRTIDQDVFIVESVVSVFDRGKWVADLDILGINFKDVIRFRSDRQCPSDHGPDLKHDYSSIDSWEEFLDAPESVGIFRAKGNWAARLAAVSILSQRGHGHGIGVFGPDDMCLSCLEADYENPAAGFLYHESPLPSFCID
jgi:hypothetical protein